MILILFVKFLIITSDIDIDEDEFFFKAKCEDDKAKTGACSYIVRTKSSNNYLEKYAIFDKCGKGKTCNYNGVCEGNIEKRKEGKSCNYDNDCLSGSCVNNKCGGANEGDSCENINCLHGLLCKPNSSGSQKCVKPQTVGKKPEYTQCMEGLELDNEGKCAKYGTLDNGSILGTVYGYGYMNGYNYGYENYNEVLCKSGISHVKSDANFNYYYVCDTLETEPKCEDGSVTKEGKWSDGTTIPTGSNSQCKRETDYTGTKKDYYSYSKLKSKLYEDFLKDYNDLDLNKINSEEGSKLFNGKTYEKYFLYKNAPALEAAGIIDSQGNVVESKKCEYEFIIKYYNTSSFIKLKAIIIAIFALLF